MKITIVDFIIHAFAIFRLALMIAKESGPGWVFKHSRNWIKRRAPKWTHMDEGIECMWCMSMQFALILTTLRFFLATNPVYVVIVFALAISGAAIAVNQAFTKDL
jgi:hypothetical protein